MAHKNCFEALDKSYLGAEMKTVITCLLVGWPLCWVEILDKSF
jgi:hypothetical protein